MSCSMASLGELLPLVVAWWQMSCHTSCERRVEPLAGGVNLSMGLSLLLRVVGSNGVGDFGFV